MKNIFIKISLIVAMALFPLSALAMIYVPAGMVPNTPPLQPHSPLVTPNISQNVTTATSSESTGESLQPTPIIIEDVMAGSEEQARSPQEDDDEENSKSFWSGVWLWTLLLLAGASFGYWMIVKRNGRD